MNFARTIHLIRNAPSFQSQPKLILRLELSQNTNCFHFSSPRPLCCTSSPANSGGLPKVRSSPIAELMRRSKSRFSLTTHKIFSSFCYISSAELKGLDHYFYRRVNTVQLNRYPASRKLSTALWATFNAHRRGSELRLPQSV